MATLERMSADLATGDWCAVIHCESTECEMVNCAAAKLNAKDLSLNHLRGLLLCSPGNAQASLTTLRELRKPYVQMFAVHTSTLSVAVWCDEEGACADTVVRNTLADVLFEGYLHFPVFGTVVVTPFPSQ